MAKKKEMTVEEQESKTILVGYDGEAKNVVFAKKSFKKGDVHPVPARLKKAINEGMEEAGFYIAKK